MTQRVTPFSLDQIGTGPVRFSSKGLFETHKDHMVNPYAHTKISKEVQIEGFQYWPQEKGHFPAIILLHERWGLTTQVKELAKRLACEGFVVLTPNLYGRQGGMVTANTEVAAALAERLDETLVLKDINACCEFLNTNMSEDASLDYTRRNVHGVVGFGMGGKLALRFACQRKRLRAAVVFYGELPVPVNSLEEAYCPIQYHAAEHDEELQPEDFTSFEDLAKHAKKEIQIHTYPNTAHGFCDEMHAQTFNANASQKAWEHMVAFLQKYLSS